jgi:hypothetical protein
MLGCDVGKLSAFMSTFAQNLVACTNVILFDQFENY